LDQGEGPPWNKQTGGKIALYFIPCSIEGDWMERELRRSSLKHIKERRMMSGKA